MKEYLDNLRAKPDHVKRRIAFLSSTGVTVVIFMFWIASFGIQSGSNGVLANGSATSTNGSSQIESPARSLTASVSDAAGNIFGGMWDAIKSTFTSGPKQIDTTPSVEVVPGNR